VDAIEERQLRWLKHAVKRLSGNENIAIMGGPARRRLPVLSFVVKYRGQKALLHSRFVSGESWLAAIPCCLSAQTCGLLQLC
jgi:hypothetical protein